VAQQTPPAFGASPRRFFPHPGILPLVSDASERGSTPSSPTRFPLSLSCVDVSHMLPQMNKHLQDVFNRLDDHANLRLQSADHEFRDHLDDAKEEAQWNITVVKDEGIESLNDTRDAVLREVEDELVTQTDDFKENLDTIGRDIIGKTGTEADEKAAAIISKADEKVAAIMSKADEKMKDAAVMMSKADKKMRDAAAMMSTAEKMAKAATASLLDATTKASGDRNANSRRPFARGKGSYRGLGTRSYQRRVEH
jgi:vacuolar-type H+-ATPase subunit H